MPAPAGQQGRQEAGAIAVTENEHLHDGNVTVSGPGRQTLACVARRWQGSRKKKDNERMDTDARFLPVETPEPVAREQFTDPAAAVRRLQELYREATDFLLGHFTG